VATAQRELVHAEHGNTLALGIGQRAEQSRQSAAAYRQPQTLGQPRSSAACQRQADGLQHLSQQGAAPGLAGGQPGDLLGERVGRAVGVVAEQAADQQPEHDRLAADRRVGQAALVAAVHPGRRATTGGADCCACPRGRPDPHTASGSLDLLDGNGGKVR